MVSLRQGTWEKDGPGYLHDQETVSLVFKISLNLLLPIPYI